MEYKAIDLGLPSGRLWADRNVGAESETDYGLYFQWGDVVGYTDTSHSTWETCPGNDGKSTYNKKSIKAWDTENLQRVKGMKHSTKILKPEVDAATVNMGDKWKMPTIEDCTELMTNTRYKYAVINGVKGGKFINKSDASKYIFFPFTGAAIEGSLEYPEKGCYIWSNSVCSGSPAGACYMITGEFGYVEAACYIYYALPVRGVCK